MLICVDIYIVDMQRMIAYSMYETLYVDIIEHASVCWYV